MAKPVLNEKTIAEYMKVNKCNREEAIDLIKYDIAIESDEETEYDLTPEQEAVVKGMMRKTDHAKQGDKPKHERKPNELKVAIIEELRDLLMNEAVGQVYEDVEITNPNRMIAFGVNGKRFELTLVEKRPPKAK